MLLRCSIDFVILLLWLGGVEKLRLKLTSVKVEVEVEVEVEAELGNVKY